MRRLSLRVRTACLCLCTVVLLPCTSGGRNDVPEEIARRGNPVTTLTSRKANYYAKQYRAKCARCHGQAGDGGGVESAGQEVPPANFTDTAYMGSRTDGQLFYQILMGGGERCAMPAFGPESDHAWSEDKIWGMVTFIRSLAEPAAE